LAAADYSFRLKPGTLTVSQAPLYVTANAESKVYGAALPVLAYNFAGFVNGDTAAAATTGVPVLSTTAAIASPVGTYPITVAGGTLAAGNYSLRLKPSALSVTQAPLYVTAYAESKAYGAALPALTYNLAGFVNGDTAATAMTGVPVLSTTARVASAVGTYPITVAAGTLAAANYDFKLKPSTLTVTKNAPTVTVVPWATTVTEGSAGTVLVTLSAPPGVSAPSGMISLYWNGELVNTAALYGNGQEAQTVAAPSTAGSLPLYAVYSGDENYLSEKSAVVTVLVQK
jgi:hypothetical protein